MSENLTLLGLAGSLRAASVNRTFLEAAQGLAPAGLRIDLYGGMGELPHFNPDIEDPLPSEVAALRTRVAAADCLIIACPEYAHGIPGTFKNLLDWLVGGHEFHLKPVVLFTASVRSGPSIAALEDVIRTMSGEILAEAGLVLHLLGRNLSADDMVADPAVAGPIRAALAKLQKMLEARRAAVL